MARSEKSKCQGIWIEKDLGWCKRHWDTYGFDYDMTTDAPVFVWPMEEDSIKTLLEALNADGVEARAGHHWI